MRTFGKTGGFTGRSNCLINYCDVTKSRNFFLCYKDFTATVTVATFGKTGGLTGGSNCFIGYRIVSKCCFENNTTNNTYTFVGAACMFVKFVSGCGHNFLCYEDFAATITVTTFGKTGVYTGGSNCTIGYRVMSKSCFEFSTTYNTNTCFGAVCMFAKGVSNCGNYLLCNKNFATTVTVRTFGKTSAFARRSNCLIGYRVMSKCCFEFSTAYSTSACVVAVSRSAGGMAESGNYLLCNKNFTATITVTTFGKTCI